MAKPTVLKTFEITAKKRWATEPKEIVNTHNKKLGGYMQVFTVCTNLPKEFSHVVSVVVNGVVAYDLKEDEKPTSSSVVGGGGRFEVRRSYYDRECVEVRITFKDMIYFGKRRPTIKLVGAITLEDKDE